MCCSFVHVLEYFQQSYPIPTYEAGIEDAAFDVLLFCDYMC
jgi:hypothetical protein